jgi:hypothetical protein
MVAVLHQHPLMVQLIQDQVVVLLNIPRIQAQAATAAVAL